MGYQFNPFTGSLDLVGASGGSGSSAKVVKVATENDRINLTSSQVNQGDLVGVGLVSVNWDWSDQGEGDDGLIYTSSTTLIINGISVPIDISDQYDENTQTDSLPTGGTIANRVKSYINAHTSTLKATATRSGSNLTIITKYGGTIYASTPDASGYQALIPVDQIQFYIVSDASQLQTSAAYTKLLLDVSGSESSVGSYDVGFGTPEVCARIRTYDGKLKWATLNPIAWQGFTSPFDQGLNTGDSPTFGQLQIFDDNSNTTIFNVIASTDDGDGNTSPAEITITPTITSPLTVSGATSLSTLSTSGAATLASLSVTGTSTFTGSPTFNSLVTVNSGLKCNSFAITAPSVPASATAYGVKGTISYDSSYLYVCTATNTWKRVALSTW